MTANVPDAPAATVAAVHGLSGKPAQFHPAGGAIETKVVFGLFTFYLQVVVVILAVLALVRIALSGGRLLGGPFVKVVGGVGIVFVGGIMNFVVSSAVLAGVSTMLELCRGLVFLLSVAS